MNMFRFSGLLFTFATACFLVTASAQDSEMKETQLEVIEGRALTRDSGLPAPPEQLTSFGAAITDGKIYLYGGHTGSAHSYSTEEQSDQLYRLDLNAAEPKWETLASGPRLQGLALVANGKDVIRVGGFTAMNEADEEQDLQSQSSVARFDAEANRWVDMPDLPEPRSSLDACVLNGQLIVGGGWSLNGKADDSTWHDTVWSLDLAAVDAKWEALPNDGEVRFTARRALSTVACDGKLFVIGGMLPEGKTTTTVLIYDPATKQWSRGPEVPGEAMEGFGTAAIDTGGELLINTISGYVHQLSDDQTRWETIAKMERSRFFHRLLPIVENGDKAVLSIGGVNMSTGKFDEIDLIVLKNSRTSPASDSR